VDPLTISTIVGLGKSLIQRIWPDPAQQAEQMLKLAEIEQRGDLAELQAYMQSMTGQLEINKAEAQHKSVFVAGARPFIIWTGGFSLLCSGILHPILMWIWAFAEMKGEAPPMIDSGAIVGIVSGLLGVSGMRSYDKKNGVQTDAIK